MATTNYLQIKKLSIGRKITGENSNVLELKFHT